MEERDWNGDRSTLRRCHATSQTTYKQAQPVDLRMQDEGKERLDGEGEYGIGEQH